MLRDTYSGLALAAFGALILTPDTLFMRLSGMDGFQMVAWRGLLMGALLLAAWVVLRGRRVGAEARALARPAGLVLVSCHLSNSLIFSFAIANAPVPVVLFGLATVPVASAILSRVVLGERTHWSTWATTAAVLSGIALAVFGGGHGEVGGGGGALLGAVLGLSAAIVMALNFVVIRGHPGLPVMPGIGTGAFCAGLVGLAVTGPADMTDGSVPAIAVTGLVILPVSFLSMSLASRMTATANVSLLMLLETVLGPAWLWLFLDEPPTPPMILGGAVVVISLAVYLCGMRWRGRRNAAMARAVAVLE